jgi:hypothetical protein
VNDTAMTNSPRCDFVHDETEPSPVATHTLNGGDGFFYACATHTAKYGEHWRVEPVDRVAARAVTRR